MAKDSFEAYWKNARKSPQPKNVPLSEDVISLRALHAWGKDIGNPLRPTFFVVFGSNRELVYERVRSEDWMFETPGTTHIEGKGSPSWLLGGTADILEQKLRWLEIPPEHRVSNRFETPLPPRGQSWDLLHWGLLSALYIETGGRLRWMLEKGPKHVIGTYEHLLKGRRLVRSGSHEDPDDPLGLWLEYLKEKDRREAYLLLLTIAHQSNLLGGVRLTLDGVESLTTPDQYEDLYDFILECDRWSDLGSPLSLILGWRGSKEDERVVRKAHPKLAKRLTLAKKWVQDQSKEELL